VTAEAMMVANVAGNMVSRLSIVCAEIEGFFVTIRGRAFCYML
jgi:hypothetical protein